MSDYISKAKPYLWGGAVGIVATLVVQFGAGWVVTTETMQNRVAQAETRVLASVCANEGRTYWTSHGNEMQALEGWDNEQRLDLAQRFTPEVQKAPLEKVTDRCNERLNPGAF